MSKTSRAALDARLDPRYPASALPSIVGLRLSPGDAVELVNISKTGVLVEGRTRFVPGTRVTVIFEGNFTPPSRTARVIRCQVSSIVAGALHYHSGIQFDKRLDLLETRAPAPPPGAPASASARHTSEPVPQGARAKNASWQSQRTAARRPIMNRW
jgi:PilZ domain